MKDITLKSKCLATIVTRQDGRLDDLTIGNLNRIINYLLTKNIYDAYEYTNELTRSSISVNDFVYISDIIEEILKVEGE
jgi:hypothetical protein